MEHVYYDEKRECPSCKEKELSLAKCLGVELKNKNGKSVKITLYYEMCKCGYHTVLGI